MGIFLLNLFLVALVRSSRRREKIALDGVHLMLFHRTEIHPEKGRSEQHHQSQQCVQVIGYRLDKDGKAVDSGIRGNGGGDGCRPGTDGGDDADRSRRGVDDIGKLCSGYFMTVRHRPHNASHSQTVEIIIHKDHHTQDHDRNLGSDPGFDVLRCPFTEGCGTACPVQKRYQDSQHNQENKNSHVSGV